MKKSIRVYFSGIVQGIFFRAFVKEQADKLDIQGFVRNLEDGRVEAFFEGATDAVARLVEICKQGTKGVKIKDMEIKEEHFQSMKGFKILHI